MNTSEAVSIVTVLSGSLAKWKGGGISHVWSKKPFVFDSIRCYYRKLKETVYSPLYYGIKLPYSGLFSWGANFRYFHG